MNRLEKLRRQWSAFLDEQDIGLIQDVVVNAQRLMAYYRCAMLEIETKFRVLDEEFSIQHERNPIDNIRTRQKSPESIIEKLHRKKLPMNMDNIIEHINDVAGIRIICPFIDDIDLLVECILRQDDIVLIQKKDYIRNPKPNGYRSLHLILQVPIFLEQEKRNMKVEVQLRTIAMDSWENLEHRLRYKKDLDDRTHEEIAQLLYECAQMSSALDEKMQLAKRLVLD